MPRISPTIAAATAAALLATPTAWAAEAVTPPTGAAGTTAATPAPAPADTARVDELEHRTVVLAEEIERLKIGRAFVGADESEYGLGPAASKVYRGEPGLSIGGYGELKYHNDLDGAADTDLHRVILYTGYKFNDKWVLNTEVEFEHVNEIFVEFAYIDYLAMEALNLRVGHVLVPMGLINEMHEPTTFLGVDRPEVEKRILPSTWHENGVGLFGSVGDLSYKAYLINGLDIAKLSASDNGVRSARQKGSHAKATDLAGVVRLDYSPAQGLTVGGSAYLGGSGQGLQDANGDDITARTLIYEGHVDGRWRGLRGRLLATGVRIDDVDRVNQALGYTAPTSTVAEAMEGYYAELGYDVLAAVDTGEHSLTPFARWTYMDTMSGVPAGKAKNNARQQTRVTAGLDYAPIEQIVFKLDYQRVMPDAGADSDELALGLGWIF